MGTAPGDGFRRDHDPTTRKAAARLLSLLAVAVAVVGAGAWLSRGAGGAPPATNPPIATPAAFPILAAPPDRPVFWLAISGDQLPTSVRLRAVDWAGREVGREGFPCLAPCSSDASPDGQRILVRQQPAEGEHLAAASVFDSAGRLVGTVVDPDVTWADDGRRLCTLHGIAADTAPGLPTADVELDLLDPAAHLRHVVVTLQPVRGLAPAGSGWRVLACSTLANRVIAAIEGGAGLGAIRVFELSTGRTLYASDAAADPLCACAVSQLDVSHDGGLAIETLTSGRERRINLATGAVTPSSPAIGVSGVSWNGGRRVTAIANDTNGIADAATGTLVWRAPAHSTVTIIAVRPGTDDLAVQVSSPRSNGAVVIILASGTRVDLPPSLRGP